MSSHFSLSSERRFSDYFVICGLDINSGLEPDQLAGDSLHCTPLDRPFRSKVLFHYPENVPWNPIDESAVGMLCLPRGLIFRTQKHNCEPQFHSFIITREDGSRTYGHAYIFYEEVNNKQICAAMQTLQAMHLTELSSSSSRIHTIHSACDMGGTRSLPRSFKLSSRHASRSGSLYDITRDTLYATKCICFITQLPFVIACRKFLMGLHKLFSSRETPPYSIETYINYILYQVPLPLPGHCLQLSSFSQNFLCYRPAASDLPLFEYSYEELLSTLGVEKVVQLFTCVLLENQILLFSENYHKLMLVAECVTMLLFPFVWQHVYVPILPASLHHFLDAPVPYIMGLHHGSEERSQLSIPGEANLCFVDIDNQVVEVPEDIPRLPSRSELISEISSTLSKFGISTCPSGLDRNLNERSSRRHHTRKLSWTCESGDSGMSSAETRTSYNSLASTHSHLLQQSEAWQRITAIAKRTGVITSLEDLEKPRRIDREGNAAGMPKNGDVQQYINVLVINNAVREIFLTRFIHMFNSYEHFIIQPSQNDLEQWLSSRETMQNFDKTAFLSDQPEPHLPFLSRFIETQMFATLIDNKIISLWEECDPYLKIFDSRIQMLRDSREDGVVRVPCYEPCVTFTEAELRIKDKVSSPDVAPDITSLNNSPEPVVRRRRHGGNCFPHPDPVVLDRAVGILAFKSAHCKRDDDPRSRMKTNSQWKKMERRRQHVEHLQLNTKQKEKYIHEARCKTLQHPKLSSVSPAAIAEANWRFVEVLLEECKMRIKRMLVEKMGQEAVELGHNDATITGLEENTLIASLCDLLERVWSHGLQSKQGKSALWSHLVSFLEVEECKSTGKPIDPNFLTPALAWCVLRKRIDSLPDTPWSLDLLLALKAGNFSTFLGQLVKLDISNLALESDSPSSRKETKDKKKVKTPDTPALKPLPTSLVYDVKNVQAMTEIKTDIGYARAFIRLSLEKKLLSKHLKKLLSNQELLRSLYKKYAFLRYDDEKEQFLYHLLTLNAVDFYCFTNTFTSTIMPYHVVIFPSRKLSASTTSANAWVIVAGTLGETGVIVLPKQMLEVVFHNKNLGILTTLRIGHDNTGISPKWMVEHILVRNGITGHTYKFPCGRWLGKGVDDGSTERLLVGEMVPHDIDNEELLEACRTPPRCRSPCVPRRPSEPKLTVPEIQQMLGDAVNNIVKYYYKPEKERGSLTILLCGELGLVYCLEQVFLYGFKATRFFRHVYLWDFFVKVQAYFETTLNEEDSISNPIARDSHEHVIVMRCYCQLVDKIDKASYSVGKDGKFQLFICFAARDHLLHRMLLHIASTPVTASMYEEQSFLRDPNLVTFLVQILESLSEFNISLEASLTKGIES